MTRNTPFEMFNAKQYLEPVVDRWSIVKFAKSKPTVAIPLQLYGADDWARKPVEQTKSSRLML
jgi:hypothetical protein